MRLGIDVSNNNGKVDWQLVKASTVTVAVIKASEGTNFHDDYYHANVRGAMDNGITVGAYHFGRPSSNSGHAEAQYFAKVLEQSPMPRFMVLDLEDTRVKPGAGLGAYALDFMDTLHEMLGYQVKLYTSHGYARDHGLETENQLGRFGLWLASWQDVTPSSFSPFSNWEGWQFSDECYIPGVGRVDGSLWQDGLSYLNW